MSDPKYQIKKLAGRKTGYPIATIAYYGPNDRFASKVVVGIIQEEGGDVEGLQRWFSGELDARHDVSITREILDFIAHSQVHRVVAVEKIIGCPHEEGIDYPEGETCPQCPFWAGRDRWSGEILAGEN
jgi:hypothetical protein